ncbi:MAG: adenosylcobinamide amidohydrolase [Actinomycetota bacterium]|nr:adenosylcobinamide amidohydrolase [Actinomycetota bacterium]
MLSPVEIIEPSRSGDLPALVWRTDGPVRAVASSVIGGGIGPCHWVCNAQVPLEYHHDDPAAHAAALAAGFGLAGPGAGLLTAATITSFTTGADGGARCDATVGISNPTWAAAPDGAVSAWVPGTINLVCWVPEPLTDAALVNTVITVTEAKAQAMVEGAVPGTGTASDAVVVCCPEPSGGGQSYGGPRSPWGARLARAAHRAVADGIARHPVWQG